jgi:predicted Zn finger-like uncharacterized protein
MISIRCPECETRLKVDDSKAGAKIRCPRCKHAIQVPDLEPSKEVEDLVEERVVEDEEGED